MKSLIEQVIHCLQKHLLIQLVRVVNYDETPAGKLEVKIRCRLINGFQFQFWLHHEPTYQDYAYQVFTEQPILRWGSAPHYPGISTAPHHFHDKWGNVSASALSGDPLKDVQDVLSEIEKYITTLQNISASP